MAKATTQLLDHGHSIYREAMQQTAKALCKGIVKKRALGAVCFIYGSLLLGGEPKVVSEKCYPVSDQKETRIYRDVVLKSDEANEVRFTLSLPEKISSEGLPCIIIVGGLETGRESLQFIPEHGQYALIGYEYPHVLKALHRLRLLWQLFAVRREMIRIPSQILAMVQYVEQEPWFNQRPVDMMGYSFGAGFIPVTYVHAKQANKRLGPGVMAYGGAGIQCLVRANFPGPLWVKRIVARWSKSFFRAVDPIHYAPEMEGNFLLINGRYDTQVPFKCATRLQHLVPEPKTIINLETEHMSPQNTALTLRLIQLSREWLDQQRDLPKSKKESPSL